MGFIICQLSTGMLITLGFGAVIFVVIKQGDAAHYPDLQSDGPSTPSSKGDDSVSYIHWFDIIQRPRPLPPHYMGDTIFGMSGSLNARAAAKKKKDNSDKEKGELPSHITFLIFFGVCTAGLLLGFGGHYIRKRVGHIDSSVIFKGDPEEPQPEWTKGQCLMVERHHVGWDREMVGSFMTYVNTKTISIIPPKGRNYPACISGAICNEHFSEGKHIFACMWPRAAKYIPGAHIMFGLGRQQQLDVLNEYQQYLVGASKTSMGLDLVKNKLVATGKVLDCCYPRDKPPDFVIPTLFYMFLDLDEGRLYFGSDSEFWGTGFEFKNNLESIVPTFPILAARGVQGKFMMFYKGQVIDPSPRQSLGTINTAFVGESQPSPKPSTSGGSNPYACLYQSQQQSVHWDQMPSTSHQDIPLQSLESQQQHQQQHQNNQQQQQPFQEQQLHHHHEQQQQQQPFQEQQLHHHHEQQQQQQQQEDITKSEESDKVLSLILSSVSTALSPFSIHINYGETETTRMQNVVEMLKEPYHAIIEKRKHQCYHQNVDTQDEEPECRTKL